MNKNIVGSFFVYSPFCPVLMHAVISDLYPYIFSFTAQGEKNQLIQVFHRKNPIPAQPWQTRSKFEYSSI